MTEYRKSRGLLVPVQKAFFGGRFKASIIRKGDLIDEFEFDNICVTEGLIAILNATFAGQGAVTSWYVGVCVNNYTPVSTDTAATIVGNFGEFTGYSGGARPTFSPAAASQPTASLNNSASRASFMFNGSATLTGAMIISSATPGAASGTLFSAAQFPSSKQVSNTDQMLLTYTLNATSI